MSEGTFFGSRAAALAAMLAMTLLGGCAGTTPDEPDDLSGTYSVSIHTLADVRGTMYLPSRVPFVRPSDPTGLPWVVLIPGFASVTGSYTKIARDVASHGFVVTALEHDFGFASALVCQTQADGFARIEQAISQLRADNRTTGVQSTVHSFPAGLFADESFAVAGHSYGGKLALWTALDVEGSVAAFGLDPVDGGGADRRPPYCGDDPEGFAPVAERVDTLENTAVVLVEAGLAGDCAPEDGNATVLYEAGDGPRAVIRIPGAAHTDFVDTAGPDCGAGCSLCPASEVDANDVRNLSVEAMVALFSARLIDGEDVDQAVAQSIDAALAFDVEDGFLAVEQTEIPPDGL